MVFKLTTKIITAVYFKVWHVPPRVRWGSANLNSIQAKEVVQKKYMDKCTLITSKKKKN